ncbi:MAG TPA: hypothetical protein PKH94_03110 [Bacteroidales bacterium]|nr:hypothetical protein [Bacteroidales bacterium]HNS46204.1 hypothetical protein [Bacteroidales bacterium]
MKLLLITILLVALAFMGIGIKMLVKKGGQFEKRCGSVDPKTGRHLPCTCGQSEEGAECLNKKQATEQ